MALGHPSLPSPGQVIQSSLSMDGGWRSMCGMLLFWSSLQLCVRLTLFVHVNSCGVRSGRTKFPHQPRCFCYREALLEELICYFQTLCFKNVNILLWRESTVSQDRIRGTSTNRGKKFRALRTIAFSGVDGRRLNGRDE